MVLCVTLFAVKCADMCLYEYASDHSVININRIAPYASFIGSLMSPCTTDRVIQRL